MASISEQKFNTLDDFNSPKLSRKSLVVIFSTFIATNQEDNAFGDSSSYIMSHLEEMYPGQYDYDEALEILEDIRS